MAPTIISQSKSQVAIKGYPITLSVVAAGSPPPPSDYTYTLDGFGNATITGYTGAGGDIIIPSVIDGHPVVKIGAYSFGWNLTLTGAIIPEGVTALENDSFNGCDNLITVTLPSTLTSIGRSSFDSCINLPGIIIPEGVISLDERVFAYCTSMSSVTFPSTLISIDDYAFQGCSNLTNITFPSAITIIGNLAFSNCTILTLATFMGDVPTVGTTIFDAAAMTFEINYQSGATGWTTPLWPIGNGDYSCTPV